MNRRAVFIFVSIIMASTFLFAPLSYSACYSHTQDFDATTGYIVPIEWTSCPVNLPPNCNVTSASIQLRTKVYSWGSVSKLSVLASDTTEFYLSEGLVGDLTNLTNPNPSNFYTTTFDLKANQLPWISNDGCINLKMQTYTAGGTTYYMDWAKLDVCCSDAYQSHSGTINSETWGPGTHYVTADVIVPPGQTLTIPPGAIVKFAPNTQLTVNGTLHAAGTGLGLGNSIVFTSRDDDSVGEIIYGSDGGSDGNPAPGDWDGIYLNGSSTNQGIGEFDYCIFRYGGNSTGSADANVYFYNSDSGHMTYCTSEHSAQQGVLISGSSPQITNSEFRNNLQNGLYSTGTAAAPTVTGNAFNNNGQYGARVNIAATPTISGNTGTGNLTNAIAYEGNVTANQTWSSMPGLPIVVPGTIIVNSNVRLTIAPGTIVKFGASAQLTVNGTVDANGTDTGWVVFTSLKDDSHGGDTNGDGNATTPAPGDWYGIYLYGSSTNQGIGEFDYCLIRYGGNSTGSADANVHFYYSDPGHMTNCISEHSAQHGVRISNSSPVIANSTITKSTLYGLSVASASLRIINSIIWGNTAGGISGTPTVLYSDVQGGFTGEGNINVDPQFLDATHSDYRIANCSPGVDAGDPVELLTADYSPGTLTINVDRVTAVSTGTPIWITDGVNLEESSVAGTTANTITVATAFAHSFTVAKRSYLFTSTSDYFGEPQPNGRRIDMGAYGGGDEAAPTLFCVADLEGSGHDVDGSDLRAFIAVFGGNSASADFNEDGIVNELDLAAFAEQFGRSDCLVCP